MESRQIRFMLVLLLSALAGACVGDDCDDDSDCLSESCTWGTCDSAVVNAAFDDQYENDPPRSPAREPTCQPKTNCEWLFADSCEAEPDCRADKYCTGSVECSIEQLIEGCPTPCELRSEEECSGECGLSFYSCEQRRSCDHLKGDECKKTRGCELR